MLSCIQLFATPWPAAHQAPLSIEFPWQEYRSGLPFPFPRDLPHPGIEPGSGFFSFLLKLMVAMCIFKYYSYFQMVEVLCNLKLVKFVLQRRESVLTVCPAVSVLRNY